MKLPLIQQLRALVNAAVLDSFHTMGKKWVEERAVVNATRRVRGAWHRKPKTKGR